VLRIRDVLSRIRIRPLLHPGSGGKKALDPGSDHCYIPDPGVKKHRIPDSTIATSRIRDTDPGSGSATLALTYRNIWWNSFGQKFLIVKSEHNEDKILIPTIWNVLSGSTIFQCRWAGRFLCGSGSSAQFVEYLRGKNPKFSWLKKSCPVLLKQ
jgi:hypothetical protein